MTADRAAQVMRQVEPQPLEPFRTEVRETELVYVIASKTAGTRAVRRLMELLVAGMVGAAALSAVVWLVRTRGTRAWPVRVRGHELVLGDRRFAAAEIVGCRVRGSGLLVSLLGGERYDTGPLLASPEALEEVAARVRSIALTPDQRRLEARARVALAAEHQRLLDRAVRGG